VGSSTLVVEALQRKEHLHQLEPDVVEVESFGSVDEINGCIHAGLF
jgi:hypothetical protein